MIRETDDDKQKLLLEMVVSKITIDPDYKVDNIKIVFTSEIYKFARISESEESQNEDSFSFYDQIRRTLSLFSFQVK